MNAKIGKIGRIWNSLTAALASAAAPRLCVVCGCALGRSEAGICLGCLAALPRTGFHRVHPNPMHAPVSNGVAPPGFAASWFLYDAAEPRAELIKAAKYHDRPALARTLGRLYATELMAEASVPSLATVDVLLPVPLHAAKLLRRGYNQSRMIALGMADVCGAAVGDNLVAVRPHSSQTHRGAAERRTNIAGTVECRHAAELDGLHVAIVDDVVTTGATLGECALAIGLAGARPASIGAITLACGFR